LFQEIYTLRGVTPGRLPAPTPMPVMPPTAPTNVQQMPPQEVAV
jgi:hypothetical protein